MQNIWDFLRNPATVGTIATLIVGIIVSALPQLANVRNELIVVLGALFVLLFGVAPAAERYGAARETGLTFSERAQLNYELAEPEDEKEV